jgi:hypothetical protein
LTAQSSARWANAIIGANNDQYRLARDAQYRHIIGLRAASAVAAVDPRHPRFRKAVSGIPTAVFRNRLSAQASRHQRKGFLSIGWGACPFLVST